jgi:signal peptidase II
MPAKKQLDASNAPQTSCNSRRLIWLLLSLVIIVTDQLSKWFVVERIIYPAINSDKGVGFIPWYLQEPHMTESISIRITSFFNIVMAWNTGVSFSLFNDMGLMGGYLLIAIAISITIIFCYWLIRSTHWLYGVGYALVIGGALGNVIDRARFGAVIDFLDVHAYGYHWPAFNVADISVVTGIGVLIIVSLFFDLEGK